jgi:hypothetical protein
MFSLEHDAQVSSPQQAACGTPMIQGARASQEDKKGYGWIYLFMLTTEYEYKF